MFKHNIPTQYRVHTVELAVTFFLIEVNCRVTLANFLQLFMLCGHTANTAGNCYLLRYITNTNSFKWIPPQLSVILSWIVLLHVILHFTGLLF